jgi:hypothetical protein
MKCDGDYLDVHDDFPDESDNIKISSGTLTLKNIQPEQAGEYTCIADQLLQTNRNIQQRSFELIVVGECLFDHW